MERRTRLNPVEFYREQSEFPYREEIPSDEIDLGVLLRNLCGEWKTMALVMAIGAMCSLAIALYLPKDYLVEAMLRVPTVHELGDLNQQNIIDISPTDALRKFVDQVLAPEVHRDVFQSSNLLKELSENSELSDIQLIRNLYEDFSLSIVEHDYYQLEQGEKTPFKEIGISLKSDAPEAAADYIQKLIVLAQENALVEISKDVLALKSIRINSIQEQLDALSQAAKQNRKAKIDRLQEANNESIHKLQQQIDLKIRKGALERENRIIQLVEAIETAKVLAIKEPVTWDDLRPLRKSTQITNELGSKDDNTPLYFRGTRILAAELDQLKSRPSDKPFIAGLTGLENQVIQLQNDSRIAALNSRANDTIYIEKYDDLQRQLMSLLGQPTEFGSAQMAVVSQSAVIPPDPIRSLLVIVLVGILLSGILALIVALVRMSMRNSEPQPKQLLAVDN